MKTSDDVDALDRDDVAARPAPWVPLALISLGAFVIRAVYDVGYARHLRLGWDATWYTGIGNSLAAGRGYSVTCPLISTCVVRQTALFPPVLPLVFAGASKLGLSSLLGRELLFAVIGSFTVFLVGLLGFRVGGRKTAYVAAALAAVNPMMILLEGSLMSEAVGVALAALLLLLLVDQARSPKLWRWFAAGGVCGVAALTRGEGTLWLVVVVGAGAIFFRKIPPRDRALGLLAALATTALVVSPWMIRNAHEFGTPYLGQPNLYPTLAATNCKAGYYGAGIGGWVCVSSDKSDAGFENLERNGETEQTAYARARKEAVTYATHHVSRWPVVVVAREARAWNVIAPFKFQLGLTRLRFSVTLFDWVLFLGAVAGIFSAVRRRITIWPLVAFLVSVSLTIAVSYGNPRYLATAGPALVVLTALAVSGLLEPRGHRTRGAAADSQ